MTRLITRRKSLLLLAAPAIIRAHAQVPMTGAGKGAPGSGVTPVAFNPTANPTGVNTGTSTATFSSVAIGSPGANDVIVVVANLVTASISSVTCNTHSMFMRANESTAVSSLQLYSIDATSAGVVGSATTTFVVTASGAANDQTIQVGVISNTLTPAPPDTGQNPATSISVTVPTNGVAVVGAYGQPPGTLGTIGGATLDYTTGDLTGAGTLFTLQTAATGSVTQTGFSSGNIHFVYAAWGP